jgi:hypothetical protein
MRNVEVAAMYETLRFALAALALAFVSPPITGWAQTATMEIQLTEKNVEGFIAAQREMAALAQKMQTSAFLSSNAQYKVDREAVSKKYGFRNFAEYEAVASTISMVITAMDPHTKEYADPHTAIKKEIEDVRADKTIPNTEKKQLLAELNEALKSAPSVEFPANVELLKKFYDKIDVTIMTSSEGDGSPTSSVVRTVSE